MIPILLAVLPAPAFPPTPAQDGRPSAATESSATESSAPETVLSFEVFAELADADRDGTVTATEWGAFRGRLASAADGPCDTTSAFQYELVAQGLGLAPEAAGDGIGALLAALDVNGDGTVASGEPTIVEWNAGATGTRGFIHRLGRSLLLEEADRNQDGDVDRSEAEAVGKAWSAGALRQWVEAAKLREPADRNAMSPGVTLLTMDSELDADRDGCCDRDRLDAWFAAIDRNMDGVLEAAERRQRRQRGESWPRPTDERRALPPLMPWQRSLDDALRVQQRTGQPLLICVNMDDETACDSLAYWQYRDPEFAALAGGFVCLVVSPDDHRPRDYDDSGRRMVSPRLGRVTDSEHIDLEPELYRRYFSGRRVAPRHVGVSPDGEVLFDIFLTNDAGRVDRALAEFGRVDPAGGPVTFADLSDTELASYPDADAREAFEARMAAGDTERRRALAALTGTQLDAGMIALRDEEPDVRAAAAIAMATARRGWTEAHGRALLLVLGGLGDDQRASVLGGLERVADELPGLRLALTARDAALRGTRIGALDSWIAAAEVARPVMLPAQPVDDALDALDRIDGLLAAPGAADALRFLRVQALFDLATALTAEQQDPRDAAAEAVVAARATPVGDPVRAEAIVACCAVLLGDHAEAIRAAHFALPGMWSALSDPLTVRTLRALATASAQSVYADLRAGEAVRASRIADALLAGRTLLHHPAGAESDALALLDLLRAVRDVTSEPGVLREALLRFPSSPELHQRFRAHLLADRGAGAVSSAYANLRRAVGDASLEPTLLWFEGLAEFLAAEWCVQEARTEDALAAYDASLDAFLASVEAVGGFADSAYHYVVLAQAGALTLDVELGNLASAFERATTAATLRPASLDQIDGLGQTPRARIEALLPRLETDDREVLESMLH